MSLANLQRVQARYAGKRADGVRTYTAGSCDSPTALWNGTRYMGRYAGKDGGGKRVCTAAPCYKFSDLLLNGYRHVGRYAGKDASGKRVYTTSCCPQVTEIGIETPCCQGYYLPLALCMLVSTVGCGSFRVYLRYSAALQGWVGTPDRRLGTHFGPECCVGSYYPNRPNELSFVEHLSFLLRCERVQSQYSWCVYSSDCDFGGGFGSELRRVCRLSSAATCSPFSIAFTVPAGSIFFGVAIPCYGSATLTVSETGCVAPGFLCCNNMPSTVYLRPCNSRSYFDPPPSWSPPLRTLPLEYMNDIVVDGTNYGPGWYWEGEERKQFWRWALLDCAGGQHAFDPLGYVLRYNDGLGYPGLYWRAFAMCDFCDHCHPHQVVYSYSGGGPSVAFMTPGNPDKGYSCCCPNGLPLTLVASVSGGPTVNLRYEHMALVEQAYYYAYGYSRTGKCAWETSYSSEDSQGWPYRARSQVWGGRSGNTEIAMRCEYDPCNDVPAFHVVKYHNGTFSDQLIPATSCSPFLLNASGIGITITE